MDPLATLTATPFTPAGGTATPAQPAIQKLTAAPYSAPVGSTPASGGALSALTSKPFTAPKQEAPPNYFEKMSDTGTFLGISDQKDISGKPFFAYKEPGQATTTDTTRVATTFDPRVPQPITSDHLTNGRMPESVSSPIKKALGGNYSDELDHAIALELSGSNAPSNLVIQPGRQGGKAAQFDTEENALAKLVKDGKMSLWDAQYKLASDKGVKLPFTDKASAASSMGEDIKNALFQPGAPKSIDMQEALKSGWDTISSTIQDTAGRFQNFVKTWQDSKASLLQKGVATGEAAMGALNAAFLGVTAPLNSARSIPVIGHIADVVNNIFSALGTAGADVASRGVDKLPISNSAKETIRPLVEEMGALVAQVIAGKAGDVAIEKISDRAKTVVTTIHDDLEKTVQAPVKPTEEPKIAVKPTEEIKGPEKPTVTAEKEIPPSTEKQIPKETIDSAEKDWEENYSDAAGERSGKIMELQNQIKEAGAKDKPALQGKLDALVKEDANIENDFINKWQGKEISLPEFPIPKENSVVLSASFPGAGSLAKFMEKDVIPLGMRTAEAVKNIGASMRDLFSPSLERKKTEAITGAALMRAEQMKSAAWKVADKRRQWWASAHEDVRRDFIDRMETGDMAKFPKEYTPEQKKTFVELSKEYRERLNRSYEYEKSIGIKENYIDNYFPHLWEDPEKAKILFRKLRNAMGKGKFTKMRMIDLIKQGRELGLKLKTDNPEELVLLREADGIRVGTKTEIMNELQAEGLAHPANTKGTEGWPIIDGTDGKMYAVTPDAAKVLENALFKPDLWSQKGILPSMFRGMMAIKGIFIPVKLALSAFHPIHIAFIRMADGITTAEKAVMRKTISPRESITDMAKATALVFQAKDVKDNYSIVKAWDKPSSQWTDTERAIIGYIIDGGGSPKMSEENLIRSRDGFRRAIKDENYIGATIRGIPKLIEAYQKPIFETYIPSLKIAAYTKTVEHLLRAHPEFATDATARKIAFREAWKSVDNRFGQMVYKTNFWNPILKNIGQASFLSLGWQIGFLREFGGGAIDLASLLKKGVMGKATAEDVTSKLLFSLNYTLIAATVGGLMTYAMTGQMPQKIEDFFYPATGDTNPDGTPSRVNTSFYTREFFTLAENWKDNGLIGGTSDVAKSKLNPIMTALGELYNNKDFLSYQIRDTNAPAATQTEQLLSYWFKQTTLPISVSGAQQAVSGRELGFSFAGFSPAPSFVNRTAIQSQIISILNARTGGTKPLASKESETAKQNIRKLYQRGDVTGANAALQDAIAKGYISERGVAAFIKAADLPSDVRAFQSLAQFPSDQEHLLSQMSAKDLARYAKYASSKVKEHLSSLSPTAYQFVQDFKAGKVQLDEFRRGQVVNK